MRVFQVPVDLMCPCLFNGTRTHRLHKEVFCCNLEGKIQFLAHYDKLSIHCMNFLSYKEVSKFLFQSCLKSKT